MRFEAVQLDRARATVTSAQEVRLPQHAAHAGRPRREIRVEERREIGKRRGRRRARPGGRPAVLVPGIAIPGIEPFDGIADQAEHAGLERGGCAPRLQHRQHPFLHEGPVHVLHVVLEAHVADRGQRLLQRGRGAFRHREDDEAEAKGSHHDVVSEQMQRARAMMRPAGSRAARAWAGTRRRRTAVTALPHARPRRHSSNAGRGLLIPPGPPRAPSTPRSCRNPAAPRRPPSPPRPSGRRACPPGAARRHHR